MQSRERSFLGEILPPEERAIEAVVARYQRVAPAVTRFARSLCGNDELRVRLGAEAASGKDEVVVNPGLFQAAYTRRAPVTPDEVALASALHEVVHLVSTDFEGRRPVPAEWLAKDQETLAEDVDLLDALNRAGGKAGEALFFALEDARQERRQYRRDQQEEQESQEKTAHPGMVAARGRALRVGRITRPPGRRAAPARQSRRIRRRRAPRSRPSSRRRAG